MKKFLIRFYRAIFDIVPDGITYIVIDIIFMIIDILMIPIKIIFSDRYIFKMELESNIAYWYETIKQKISSKFTNWYNIFS